MQGMWEGPEGREEELFHDCKEAEEYDLTEQQFESAMIHQLKCHLFRKLNQARLRLRVLRLGVRG